MADKITLIPTEQRLYESLKQLVEQTKEFYKEHSDNFDAQEDRYSIMAKEAHELHMSLKARGKEPKHHKYMYVNRGVPAEDVEFYNHLHSVEDLLSFIDNPDSTRDPEDTTINAKFDFDIFSRRWGHSDRYELERTRTGWRLTGGSSFNNNDADKSGHPSIFSALQHDSVCYPYNIGDMLEWVWIKASEGATKEEVQQALSDLAEWITICELATPKGMFEDFI